MSPVCIVTDSSVQFTQVSSANRSVIVIPLISRLDGQGFEDGESKKVNTLPPQADDNLFPRLIAPSTEKIQELFSSLALSYDGIFGIFISAQMSAMFANALSAASSLRGGVNIQIVDSQSISVGLGFQVEAAAEAAAQGKSITEIERFVRSLTTRIYGVISTPSPSYLFYNGFIDRGQALISEMLGLFPVFAIEEGNLAPMEKVRNHRHTINYFQEFLDEFEDLGHIALLQSCPPSNTEGHILRDHLHENFAKTPFTSHAINLSLATLFGPRTLGLFVYDRDGS